MSFIKIISLLVVVFINFILAGLIYSKKRDIVAKLFVFLICSIVSWMVPLVVAFSTFGRTTNLLWVRTFFAFAHLIPFSFLLFVEVFPEGKTIVFRRKQAFWAFLVCILFLLSYSPELVNRMQYNEETGKYSIPDFGPVFYLHVLYILSCFGDAFFIFGRKWRKAQGFSKLQIQYLFLGLLFSCVGTITTNLIISVLFNAYQFGIYGPYFSILFVGFTAHAIIRYRLMDIKAIISRGMVYFLSSVIALGILIGLFFSIKHVFHTSINIPKEALIIATALSSIIVFLPLKRSFQFLIDKYLYREAINLQRVTREASQTLTSVLEQDELLDYLGQMIVQQMKVESVFIFLREKEENSFHLKLARSYFDAKIDIPVSLSIGKTVFLQEIERRIKNNLSRQEKFLVCEELSRQSEDVVAQKISEELTNLCCNAVFPLVLVPQKTSYGELIGVLCVGPKLSGDPYFQTDLDLLSMVTNQASIAIKNAQLYAEVNFWKEYNENVLRNMESGVITVDKVGIVKTFNEGAEHLTGISREQAIGKDVTALGSNISTLILAALHRHELNRHSETTIKTAVHKVLPLSEAKGTVERSEQDYRSMPIVFSTSLLRDKNGEILGSLIVFSDLSQIKKLEEEKRKMERLATMGNIAAGLTHEIKNQLVPLRTFAELFPERHSDPEFRESFSQIALQQIDKINELVSQMRDLAHPPPTHFASVNIDEPIENVLNLLNAKIGKTGVQVIKDYAQEIPTIWADESQLRQLFLNLMMNSLQAMPQGGKLYINIYVQPFFSDSRFICVDIKDTGEGIAEEYIEKVFDPFFTKTEGGTGLGLTICQNIVDLHKGNIRINNNKTREFPTGVAVTVRFPINS